ncbi:MAG: sulfatase [Planctomycetota bacterium]|nr:MAG: sulfatase [Planctomycetota bacterium]
MGIISRIAYPVFVLVSTCILADSLQQTDAATADGKFNVLFIAVDDLRPELGCYGVTGIKSPNIDKLAREGTLFKRAYCQQAVCSPSRTSLLTGRRPDTTKIYDLSTHFRLFIPEVVTLPQYFKQHGYHSQALGKIYHGTTFDDPESWSVKSWHSPGPTYAKPETLAIYEKERERLKAAGRLRKNVITQQDSKTGAILKLKRRGTFPRGPSWEDPDVPDNKLPDGKIADQAIEVLREIKDKPFFLAVGFLKPHLPFVAPKKYFDLYPPEKFKLPDNPFPPKDVPPIALMTWGELRAYTDIPKKGPLSDEKTLELRRAYYAATTFTDTQIGRVIDELERLGLRDRTVIVLWGDHGWQLGEHGLWCKHTNFELATHSPMIFSVPNQKNKGAKTDALSEFVDIYPTLCELCNLPIPEGLEGTSLVPVMNDPGRPWKKAAFSQYPRGPHMGYSMKTDRYRYTEWAEKGKEPVGIELYDHQNDPDENVNIANRPENKELVAKLSKMLHAGWQAALPNGYK